MKEEKEVEQAVIRRGKYQLKKQHQFLEVPQSKWFLMTPQQRKDHLSKLQSVVSMNTGEEVEPESLCLKPSYSKEESSVNLSDSGEGSSLNVSTSALSVDTNNAAQVNIPFTCLEGIWVKDKQLIATEGAIVPAQLPEARMGLSYSGKAPHMVTPKKGGDFSCDSSCPNWKSLRICSHSVAVAEINGKLPQFISAKKRRHPMSLAS